MHVIREQPLVWDRVDGWIGELKRLIAARREQEIISHLQRLVPEYSPASRGGGQLLELVPASQPDQLRSAS